MNAERPTAGDVGRPDPHVQHRLHRPKFTVTEGAPEPDYGPKERILARLSPLPAKRNIPNYITSGDADDLPVPKKGKS